MKKQISDGRIRLLIEVSRLGEGSGGQHRCKYSVGAAKLEDAKVSKDSEA